jgi:anti-anti-sigma factor
MDRPPTGRVVVRLEGELDMATADEAREALEMAAASTSEVAVDLGGLEFVGSSGFRVFHEAHLAARAAGSRLVFVSPSSAVVRVIALMGFDHLELSDDRAMLDGHASPDGTA